MSVPTLPATRDARDAWLVAVTGVVQGVGFRPFVHRLARRFGLGGHVRNVAADVEILIEGETSRLHDFVRALREEAPPLARIASLAITPAQPGGGGEFLISESGDRPVVRPHISPDVAPCAECEAELYDTSNRRAGYAFITCTNCGPRHSVIEDLPYDRARTTMRAFVPCPACEREYHDIGDRRYRSETNACPVCGPSLALLDAADRPLSLGEPVVAAAALLRRGAIVAVRGVGGFHLAADATNETAVARLRRRKRREGKPLAVMVRRLEDARSLAHVSDAAAALLVSPERPIVIVEARADAALAPSIGEGLANVGLMLPCSPLHMLLLDAAARPLVMTSGNPTSLPLAARLDEARATLGDVADAFLTHDREIAMPIDDSVVRVALGESVVVRRARGFAPLPLPLPIPAPKPTLAVGGQLKNTFALAEGREAYVSQHIGDLDTLETVQHWERSFESLSRMVRIRPALVARDLHPEYASSRLAERLTACSVEVVQHHHAHVAAVAAEHGVTEPVVGVAFDGTGLGTDGAIWGAEFLVADLVSFRRVGHLRYAPLPGGDRAARDGWRAALGYAHERGADGDMVAEALRGIDPRLRHAVRRQCAAGLNAPMASSIGRLFDAAAAITGICTTSRYEGEAAMRLESAAAALHGTVVPLPVSHEGGFVIDPFPILSHLAAGSTAGEHPAVLAASFHDSVAEAAATVALAIAERERLNIVALGGGAFQNARLLHSLRGRLRQAGLYVLTSRQLPPNDGGLSYGQAAIAAARTGLVNPRRSF